MVVEIQKEIIMVQIKIEEFAKKYIETNKEEKLDDVIKRLEESLDTSGSTKFSNWKLVD